MTNFFSREFSYSDGYCILILWIQSNMWLAVADFTLRQEERGIVLMWVSVVFVFAHASLCASLPAWTRPGHLKLSHPVGHRTILKYIIWLQKNVQGRRSRTHTDASVELGLDLNTPFIKPNRPWDLRKWEKKKKNSLSLSFLVFKIGNNQQHLPPGWSLSFSSQQIFECLMVARYWYGHQGHCPA